MENVIQSLLVIGIIIGLFFLFRKVTLWYFKINEIVDILERQLNNQRDICALLENLVKKEPKDEANSISS